jgi:hypothetical protein
MPFRKAAMFFSGQAARSGQTFSNQRCWPVFPQMKVAKEETFGRLRPLFRFETDEEELNGQRHRIWSRELLTVVISAASGGRRRRSNAEWSASIPA